MSKRQPRLVSERTIRRRAEHALVKSCTDVRIQEYNSLVEAKRIVDWPVKTWEESWDAHENYAINHLVRDNQ